MTDLRIEQVRDESMVKDWQRVHNAIIPTAPLSLDEVRERVGLNRLAVAYADDVLVGCSTVRPPTGTDATATVIARVLPAHRRQGTGEALYVRGLATARELGAEVIETIILASNEDGLQFARRRGFVEVDSYLPPGDTIPFITLRLRDIPAAQRS